MDVINCTPHPVNVYSAEAAARLADAAKRAAALVEAAKGLDAEAQRIAAEEAAALWAEALAAETPLAVFPPSGSLIRVAQTRREVGTLAGVPVSVSEFGQVEGLPEYAPDTWLIVSALTLAAAPDRPDLIVPAPAVRDWKGQVIGCSGFDTIPAGAARLAAFELPTPPDEPAEQK